MDFFGLKLKRTISQARCLPDFCGGASQLESRKQQALQRKGKEKPASRY